MTLCSAADDILFRDIEQAIRTMGATHLNLVPTAASLVNPNNVPNVKFLLTSGEELTPKVFKDWAGKGLYQGILHIFPPFQITALLRTNVAFNKDMSQVEYQISAP